MTLFSNAEIETVEQLTQKSPQDILKYCDVGAKTLTELRLRLGSVGLALKEDRIFRLVELSSDYDDLLKRKMALEIELADVTQQVEEIEEARKLEKDLKPPLDENAIYEQWKTGKTFTKIAKATESRPDIVSEICWSRLETDCKNGNPPQLLHKIEKHLKCKSCWGLIVVRYQNEPRHPKCPHCGRTSKHYFRV